MIHAIPQVTLHLDPSPPSASPPPTWPPPAAAPRLVSSLPPSFSDSKLFDTFRGFGAIATCRMHPDLGPDVGIVTFWREEDATRAEEIMHMSEVDDFNISVKVWNPGRGMGKGRVLEFNPQAPSFVPSGLSHSTLPGGIQQQQGGYQPSLRHAQSPPLQPFTLSPMPSPHLPLGSHSPMMMPGAQLPVMASYNHRLSLTLIFFVFSTLHRGCQCPSRDLLRCLHLSMGQGSKFSMLRPQVQDQRAQAG
jgi:polyadenylate-binding protein